MKYSGRHVASVALVVAGVFAVPALIAVLNSRLATAQDATTSRQPEKCPGDNGGLTLSPGFCASIFADNLGHVRHMVVASDGTVYANTWSGRYFPNSPPPPGGFLLALKDTKGNGPRRCGGALRRHRRRGWARRQRDPHLQGRALRRGIRSPPPPS